MTIQRADGFSDVPARAGGRSGGRIKTYEAWRGIAAVMILFSHMSYLGDAVNPFWRGLWEGFMHHGGVATSFFFLSSGFFLHYAWRDGGFGRYMKGKLRRIYPLTLLVFLLALALDLALSNDVITEGVATGSPLWFLNVAANLLLFKAFVPMRSVYYSFHGPSWFVSVLIAFYAVGYWFVRGLHDPDEEKRLRWRRAVCCVAALAYALQTAVFILVEAKGWPTQYPCYINPYFRIFGEGFAGILLCEFGERRQHSASAGRATLWEMAAALLFIADFALRSYFAPFGWQSLPQIIPMGLVLIAFRGGKGAVSRFLEKRPSQFLGGISFELYMTHAFVYEGLPVACGIVSKPLRSWLIAHAGTRFVITFVLCIVFAWIVHEIYGRVARRAAVSRMGAGSRGKSEG